MMKKAFRRSLLRVYNYLKKRKIAYWIFPKKVCQDISVVGNDEHTYYFHKFIYVGTLFFLGIGIVLCYFISQVLVDGKEITNLSRPEVYEETSEVTIQAGKQNDIFCIEIAPPLLDKEEAELLFQESCEVLSTYILGENENLEHVTQELLLPGEIPGYPFEIYWESDKEDIVSVDGTVNRMGLMEDEVVILTAMFQYNEWIWEEQFGVMISKEVLSEEEGYKRRLEKLFEESEKEQRNENFWAIPGSFDGEDLEVRIVENDYTLLLLGLIIIIAAIMLWIGKDYDLHTEREKRKEIFLQEYLPFVERLSLYISSGLTLQMAMKYCAEDYGKRKGKEILLKNTLLEFQKNLQNGVGFLEAMESLAAQTDCDNYKKLAGILNQGMINGSRGLSEVLEKELEKVREEKRRQCGVKGGQISTALIAPMMLQLCVVIALVMIPAFDNMNF